MEKIKKISLFLVLVLILSICFYTKTYAALSCSVSMSASSNEVTEGNEFTVSIGVNNIQSDKGVIIYGGTVEYDKNILTCTGKSGAGEWAPSFNKENGKFVADRDNGFAKTGETVLKLTFKVKEGASGSTSITVKDALASDGIEDKSAGTAKTTINIKSKDSGNKDEGENQGGNSNQGGSNSGEFTHGRADFNERSAFGVCRAGRQFASDARSTAETGQRMRWAAQPLVFLWCVFLRGKWIPRESAQSEGRYGYACHGVAWGMGNAAAARLPIPQRADSVRNLPSYFFPAFPPRIAPNIYPLENVPQGSLRVYSS